MKVSSLPSNVLSISACIMKVDEVFNIQRMDRADFDCVNDSEGKRFHVLETCQDDFGHG